ncbi:MAG: DUF2911 domain-containing protein [Cyclobacteriaceae bacterium]
MKNLFATFLIVFVAIGISANVQAQDFPKADKSILDVSYYPARAAFAGFEKTEEGKKNLAPKLRVMYSRPAKNDRDIFGGLQKYGEMWRVGANESTELMVYTDVKVGGKTLKAGERYSIHAMVNEKEWTIYFSTILDSWGSYGFQGNPDATTVAKVTVPTQKTASTVELLGIYFEKADNGADMIIGWDDTMVKVPFKF